MSFSKAKVKRFNDIKAPVRPSYVVSKNVKENVKAISKTPVNSDYSSDAGSIKSTPCFRTPNAVDKPKKNIIANQPKVISKERLELEILKDKIVECENKDASLKELTEQLEEFKEKISILEKQKSQLNLDKENYEQALFLQNVEHSKQLQKQFEEFEENMVEARCKELELITEINILKERIEILKQEHFQDVIKVKDDSDKMQETFQRMIEEERKVIELKSAELIDKEQELNIFQKEIINLQREHALEVEKIRKAHQLEIQDIEFEFLKTMTELQNEKDIVLRKSGEVERKAQKEMEQLHQLFSNEKETIINECEQKIKEIKENLTETFEHELNTKLLSLEVEYKNKLEAQQKESDAILKECQTISEFNIIQSEIEKNKIKSELEEKTEDLVNMTERCEKYLQNCDKLTTKFKNLENELNRTIKELNETREVLTEKIMKREKIIDTICKEKATYEISIKTYQTTIEVLKKRLINSDRDVEQLKQELTNCEEKILEYESKCLQLDSDLKQAQMFNEELEMQFDSTIRLNRTEIENMRNDLCQKLDLYKEEVEKYSKRIQEEEANKEEVIKLQKEVERLKGVNGHYEFEIRSGQNELEGYHLKEIDWSIRTESFEDTVKQLEDELNRKHNELRKLKMEVSHLRKEGFSEKTNESCLSNEEKNIYAKYIQVSGRYDEILQKFEDIQKENIEKDKVINNISNDLKEYAELRQKCSEQEQTIKELTKRVEKDKELKNNYSDKKHVILEEERDHLLNKVQRLNEELKEVSNKYADMAGHQNNKQRIKHLSDLKQKNEELLQQNMDLSLKMKSQKKELDRFKKENADLKKCLKKQKYCSEDKENLGSPRSLNTSRVESPFRERN